MDLLYAPACQAWHLRRDSLDSVLRTFWNWHYIEYDDLLMRQAGAVANQPQNSKPLPWWEARSTEHWVANRLQSIWRRYRLCRMLDLDLPDLRPITFLLPWSWIMRDLFALRKTAGEIGNICNGLCDILVEVAKRYGIRRVLTVRFIDWLTKLGKSLENGEVSPYPMNRRLFTPSWWPRWKVFRTQTTGRCRQSNGGRESSIAVRSRYIPAGGGGWTRQYRDRHSG